MPDQVHYVLFDPRETHMHVNTIYIAMYNGYILYLAYMHDPVHWVHILPTWNTDQYIPIAPCPLYTHAHKSKQSLFMIIPPAHPSDLYPC